MNMPPSYLRTWTDRFRHPRVCLALADEAPELPVAPGHPPLVTAMLDDLAAHLDDAAALGWLIEQEQFTAAEQLIAGSPAIRSDPDLGRVAQHRLTRQQAEARQILVAEAESHAGRAEAAGLPVPPVFTTWQDEDWAVARIRQRFAEAARRLDDDIRAATRRRRGGAAGRGLPRLLKQAWLARLDQGHLVAADRLLAMRAADAIPPDVVRRPRPWDPTVAAMSQLRDIVDARSRGWTAGWAGRELLSAYEAMREVKDAESVDVFAGALAAFVGTAPGRPAEHPFGYVFRLDLSAAAAVLPLPWLADVRVVVQLRDGSLPQRLATLERLIVVDCGDGWPTTPGRSAVAVLTPADLVRLATAQDPPAAQLLRLLGRSWTGRAVGIKDSRSLADLLAADSTVAWARLAWLVDILELGGVELARILTDEVGLHPGGLHLLLEILLGIPAARVQRLARVKLTARSTTSQLTEIVLPAPDPDPSARIAFLAAVAADGFEATLAATDLQLSIAIEGGDAPEHLVTRGMRALSGHPLVESTADGIRLLRCGVLRKLRDDAPRLLLEALAAAEDVGRERAAWSEHRWALIAGDPATQPVDLLHAERRLVIDHSLPATEGYDLVPVLDAMSTDLRARYPNLDVILDLPAQATAVLAPEVFRTLLAEIVHASIDARGAPETHRLAIAVDTDQDHLVVEVVDNATAPAIVNPAAFFGDGRPLHDAARLAQRVDAYLQVLDPDRESDLRGPRFRLIVRRPPRPGG